MGVQTATNPQTGETVVLVDNAWQKAEKTASGANGEKAYLVGGKWLTGGAATPPVAAPEQGNYLTEGAKNIALGGVRGGPWGALTAMTGEGMKGLDKVGKAMGGYATDLGARNGLPPEASAAIGTIAELAPSALTGGTTGVKAAAPLLEAEARSLMQQALRPGSKALANKDAYKAIDTMLEEGIPATTAGAAMLRQKITALKGEVGKLISDNPGTLVDKGYVYKELASTLDDVSKLARPDAPMAAVRKAWQDFKNHPLAQDTYGAEYGPEKIPLAVADEIKRATQQSVKDAYGRQATTPLDDKIDMAMAAGLRKGAEAEIPEIGVKNAKLSEFLNALHQVEPRAAQAGNTQVAGFAPLAGSPEAAIGMLADRNPWIKSLLARILYSGQNTISGAAGATVGGAASEVKRK